MIRGAELPDSESAGPEGFTRAAFLKAGGALVIGIALPSSAVATASAKPRPRSARSPVDPSKLRSWLAVRADGTVIAFTGKVDLGQGNSTALTQIIAEELDVPFGAVKLVMGDTARCVDQNVTADSTTITHGGSQLRDAAANGRQLLIELAATRLGVPATGLTVRRGVVIDRSDPSRRISYGKLIHGRVMTETIPVTTDPMGGFTIDGAVPKPVDQYTLVGRSVPRIDIPPKVTGRQVYVHDVTVPGMAHGRVIRPPALGARLISHGRPPAGVEIVRIKDFLAVAAADEWTAIQAAANLQTRWTRWAKLPPSDTLYDYLRTSPSEPQTVQQAGDVQAGLSGASRTLAGRYDTPLQTHGSIGPSCAVAHVRARSAMIHAGTQGPNDLQSAVAEAVGLEPDNVHVLTYPASGCYGRNGADPSAIDAAIMSKALGKPVRVQWMRHDEHGWDPKGPATTHDLRAGFDAAGNLVAWDHQGWLPANFNITVIGSVLAGGHVAMPVNRGGWSGHLLYDVPNVRLLSHNLADIAADQNHGVGVISAWLRSPAQFQVTFAQESFLDEVAAAANADPLQFRLRHLTDQRLIAAFNDVAKLAGWRSRPSPGPPAHNNDRHVRGRGIAGSLRGGTYNAEIAEVVVDRRTGEVTVEKIWVVQDNGLTINPRAVVLGVEAGVVQTTSRTLLEEVTFDRSAITSLDWVEYPIVTFEDAPEVTVKLTGSKHDPPGGSGEPDLLSGRRCDRQRDLRRHGSADTRTANDPEASAQGTDAGLTSFARQRHQFAPLRRSLTAGRAGGLVQGHSSACGPWWPLTTHVAGPTPRSN